MSGKVFEIFEIDIPYCNLSYGVSPCAASLGVTGSAKCFNGLASCQDTDNIDLGTKTLRFCTGADYVPREIGVLPWIRTIDFTPATVSLGENLGQRASLKVTIGDHQHSDAGPGLDKYHAERGYDPYARGTYWPRFRARYPSVQGFACRWRIGAVGQSLEEMETRHFFLESFDGPKADGTIVFNAKDVLKFLDGDRAQVPRLSGGSLQGSLNTSATNPTLTPAGVGNAEYPASGYVCIGGNEVCSFTRSGDALTLTRAQLGTAAQSHAAGDRVQLVQRYASQDVADIIEDIITGYTDLPAFYIPLTEWQNETATYLAVNYTLTLVEPTSVSTVLSRLIEQAGVALFDDPVNQKLRLRVIRAVPITASLIDESNIVVKSFDQTDQPEKRCSRAHIYYAPKDPTKKRDELSNYSQTVKVEDVDSDALFSGQPAIRTIFADAIPVGGSTAAGRVGAIIVGRNRLGPKRFKFSQDRSQITMPELGEGINVQWRTLQDFSGARETVPAQIIRLKPGPAIQQAEAEEMRFSALGQIDPNDRHILIDFDTSNINLRTIHDQNFPSVFEGVTVTVTLTSIIGSASAASKAVDVGSWPTATITGNRTSGSAVITGIADTSDLAEGMFVSGTGIPAKTKILTVDSGSQITLDKNATSGSGTSTAITVYIVKFNLVITGRAQGHGGDPAGPDPAGEDGGTALYTRYPINLDASLGDIWGGGGGGGKASVVFDNNRADGGGGAGRLPGAAGHNVVSIGAATRNPKAGTETAGGDGGIINNTYQIRGGNGGGPGEPGQSGSASGTSATLTAGGAAGPAIDGDSYVTLGAYSAGVFTPGLVGTEDIRGPQIN